jgi:peroxiredoxin
MFKNLFILLIFGIISFNISVFSKGPGEKADNFTINNYDGKSYVLEDALKSSQNGVIIIFWSTECPFVQPYNDRINEYVKHYNHKGFIVWIINSNNTESIDEVKSHAEKNKYTFPVLKDINNIVADSFGAARTPEAFVIGKDFTILYHGRISDNKSASEEKSHDLKNAVDEISSGNEVTVKETKSFGCTIKRVE